MSAPMGGRRRCADCDYVGDPHEFMAVGIDASGYAYMQGILSESVANVPVCRDCCKRLADLPWSWLSSLVEGLLFDASAPADGVA